MRTAIALLLAAASFASCTTAPSTLTIDLTVIAERFRGSYMMCADFDAELPAGTEETSRYYFVGYAQGETTQRQQIPLPRAPLRDVRIAPLRFPGPGRVTVSAIRVESWFDAQTLTGARLRAAVEPVDSSLTLENGAAAPTAFTDGATHEAGGIAWLRLRGLPQVNAVPLGARLLLAAAVAGAVLLAPALGRGLRPLPPARPDGSPSPATRGDLGTAAVCALLSLGYFLWSFGPDRLVPTNVRWLMESAADLPTYYLGWSFFRNDAWAFPPGLIRSYFAPVGTAIATTDSVPLLAFLFKPLAPLLPRDFQYFGWWLLLCFVLQGFFGWLLMRRVTTNRGLQVGGAFLFIASPPLLARNGHLALMAHWLLLAALYLYLEEVPAGRAARRCALWAGLAAASALIQPYFAAMVLAIFLAWVARALLLDHVLPLPWAVPAVAGAFGGAFVAMYLAGNFQVIDRLDYGWWYKLYASNLNALVNSQGRGLLLPGLATRVQRYAQYEGFHYLGLGVLLLAGLALGRGLLRRGGVAPARRHAPLAVALLLLAVFSLGNEITLGQHTLLQYPVPAFLKVFTNAFRSSARFLWPAFYAIVYAVLAATARAGRSSLSVPAMALACVVQLADVSPLRPARALPGAEATGQVLPYRGALRSPAWPELMAGRDRVVMLPAFARTYNAPEDYRDFAFLAARAGRPITTGYVARTDAGQVARAGARFEASLRRRPCDRRTLYVLGDAYYRRHAAEIDPGGRCRHEIVDGYHVLLSRNAPDNARRRRGSKG